MAVATETASDTTATPADAPRWQPVRAGLLNVWRYEEEVFEFHHGRLLLRGPNGSGKSMALELLFPFLLDANAQPWKLTSAAKHRGGLYERFVTGADAPSPVGFLWAEFACGQRYFTVGVRLRASTQTRQVTQDWFTTTSRVGDTLRLLDDTRTPLSRKALCEAIGDSGAVHDNADGYRRAVRTTLFPGFDARQLDALLSTLHALRREKISQDLDPKRLHTILSESLPPLDEFDVAEAAEGFEKLDRRRENLQKLEADLRQVDLLARRQRSYASAVLATVAAAVRTAQSERDTAVRKARESAEALERTTADREAVAEEDRATAARDAELAATVDALHQLDAYRAGAQLAPLRDEVGRARTRAREEASSAEVLRLEAADDAAKLQAARKDAAEAEANEDRARIELVSTAEGVNAAGPVDEAVAGSADDADRLLAAWVDAREREVAEVRRAVTSLTRATDHRDRESRTVDDERTNLDEAVGAASLAAAAADDAAEAYVAALHGWVEGCVNLDREALREALTTTAGAPVAVNAAVAAVTADALAALAVERSAAERQVADAETEAMALREERADLESGTTPVPPRPEWRPPDARVGRAGAPLWRLVDVAVGVDAPLAGRVESALLAAGVLDAWVDADGSVDLPDGLVDLLIGAPEAPTVTTTAGTSLADVLVPLSEVEVPALVVARVLRAIALVDTVPGADGDGHVAAIGRDGSFRLGPVVGRGPDGPAGYLGAAAQEQRRRRRIAEIDGELSALGARIAEARGRASSVNRRVAAVRAESTTLPSGAAVDAARTEMEVCDRRVGDARVRRDRAVARLEEAEVAVKAAQRELANLAATSGLPTDGAALEEYASRLATLRARATAWIRRRRDVAAQARVVDAAVSAADRAERQWRFAAETAETADGEHRTLAARLEALEANVGAKYQEIVAQVQQADAERKECARLRKDLTHRASELDQAIGELRAVVAQAEVARGAAEEARAAAHLSFVAAVADGLPGDAGPKYTDAVAPMGGAGADTAAGVTVVLDAARAVLGAAGELPDERRVAHVLSAVQEAVHETRRSLGSGLDIAHDQAAAGPWWLLRCTTDGVRRTATHLREGLEAELAAARDELRDEEQRLFSDTLTGSVRYAVAERIRRANDIVDGTNRELSRVKTAAAGVGVRLRWDVDKEQPDSVRTARKLLLRDAADLTDAERASLFDFFRARLEDARARLDPTTGWKGRLHEALDYRAWHVFTVELSHRDWDGYQPATSQRLARLSTGERSMALHLPMLASVAAHYDGVPASGDAPRPPRLILLDELFAGVDVANRTQLFGQFVTWDLDAVLTSDHEWCTYASLDGIAIHHLHPAGPGEPVTTTRFVWDGSERRLASVGGAIGAGE